VSTPKQPDLPAGGLNREDLAHILRDLNDYIGVHSLIFDEWGTVLDTQLVWWNSGYERIRTKEVQMNQTMLDTYFEPHISLAHVHEAWEVGQSIQLFELLPTTRDRYREEGQHVVIQVNWQRVGDHVVEVGTDLSDFVAIQNQLADQRSLVSAASRKRALAIERERIAQGLHDSVIQRLYAASLSLQLASKTPENLSVEVINSAVVSIAEIIDGIRNEIFKVESRSGTPLRIQLEDILIPILAPTDVDLDLVIDVPAVGVELISHIRAVSIEAVSNAVRHGGAKRVTVSLTREGASLRLRVSDDGRGMSAEAQMQNGLKNMRQRAQSLGGNMEILTNDSGGTIVEWIVPHPGWAS
jgi:signal transduction histidine kinase